MYYFGVVTSTLFNAGILGIPLFFVASFMFMFTHFFSVLTTGLISVVILVNPIHLAATFVIIYTMINVIPSTATWTSYLYYFTNYQTLSSFDSFIQIFLPYYHYSTGLSSVLIYSLIKASGV
jgi:hypothetical protein